MPSNLHNEQTRVHAVIDTEMQFADSSARTGFAYTPEDVGKMIWQLDNDTFYILIDDSPVTFTALAAANFVDLSDTPGSYAGGDAGKLLRVNIAETAVEFSAIVVDTNDDLLMVDNVIVRPELKDYSSTVDVLGSVSGTVDLDLENGNTFTLTQTGNITITMSNPPASGTKGTITLVWTMDGTGGYTRTWPGSADWPAGTEPTASTGAGQVDVYTFFTVDGGTTWYGFLPGADMS